MPVLRAKGADRVPVRAVLRVAVVGPVRVEGLEALADPGRVDQAAGTAAAPPVHLLDPVRVPLVAPGPPVPAIPVALPVILETRQVALLPPAEDQTAVRAVGPEAEGVRAVPRVVRMQDRPAGQADLVAADLAVVGRAQVVLLVLVGIMVMATETVADRAAAARAAAGLDALLALPMTAVSATEE